MSEFPKFESLGRKDKRRVIHTQAVLRGLMDATDRPPEPSTDPTMIVVPQPEVGVGYTDKDVCVVPVSPERHTSPNFYL